MNKRLFPIILILIVALARVARHFGFIDLPPNFAPVAAAALFAGAYIKDRRLAIGLPLLIMFLSDLMIGFYDLQILAAVYASFMFSGLLGLWVGRRKNLARLAGATIGASVSFYLMTNLAVWLFSGMYDLTAAGLARCYILALPFFRNTVAGDMFYVGLFFGLAEIIQLGLAYYTRTRLCHSKI